MKIKYIEKERPKLYWKQEKIYNANILISTKCKYNRNNNKKCGKYANFSAVQHIGILQKISYYKKFSILNQRRVHTGNNNLR